MEVCLEIDDTAKRVLIPKIIGESFLKKKISEVLDLTCEIKIQIFVMKYNSFCDLESISEIEDGSRLKIMRVGNFESNSNCQSNLRNESYNKKRINISIEDFSLISQSELKQAKERFADGGKYHKASYKLKMEINEIFAKKLMKYGMYPTNEMYDNAGKQLITEFCCLKEPIGNGWSGWKIAMKYKIQEIRRNLKSCETILNTGKKFELFQFNLIFILISTNLTF